MWWYFCRFCVLSEFSWLSVFCVWWVSVLFLILRCLVLTLGISCVCGNLMFLVVCGFGYVCVQVVVIEVSVRLF